eukprot:XP_011674596.1 PREDICTED: structural maintenance of chromosomes protein 2 [Strongylocentrotus purpuratus]
MYIKEIIVDGFKSYAQRTEIKGFDPLFNAITGLNGSGKSNILDSICFLLGISNLSQVRAGSLQELVYKGGQAGVTKATVTIVFDNKDKKQSPVGYDSFDEFTVSRQVVIGGRNKYLINGSNANNSRVQDLFCSVQLNVNNPHFLIMQGRITKVLNMKPPEILSMIEEAAGTRMYENKKASAQKTIEKKDAKLKEIESVLNEEITPTLTRLNEERSSYLEYQKVLRELDHLTKLHVAYQFVSAEKLSKESEQELGKIAEATTAMRQRMKEIDDKLLELTNTIQALEKERDEEAGGVLKEIEKRLVEAQNSDTKIQSSLQHKKEAVTNEKKNKKAVEKSYTETVLKSKTKLEDEMKKLGFEDGKEDDLENQHKTLSAKVDNLSDKVNALTSRFPNLQFEYKDPEKNFDRSKVHGLVARLLKVKDVKYATSLEVTAGRKLYNVVVDTEHTGKKLLQKGELKRRFTIIPLNKIAARSISGDTVRAAQNLVGKENVRTALTLVGYEKDVQSAMEFVFGSSLVCNDTAHAKKVTFDPKVRTRTVTLAGDTFDPSGTLTGGARNNSSSVLRKLSELQEAEEALFVEQEKLNAVKKELAKIRGSADKMRALKDQYDLKVHEAQLLEERLKQGTHHSKLEEINALKASVEEQDKMIGDAKTKQKETTERTKNLEEKIKDASAVRERELKTAEQEVTKSKKKAEETNKQMKQKQQEMNSLKFEVDNLKQELTKYDDQLTASDQAIEAIQAQQEEMEQQAKESKVKVKETKKELDGQKEKLKEKNQDIQAKISEREALKKEDQDTQLQIKEQEHVANKITRDSADAVHRVENLMTKYEWIASERQFFGQPNTAYDFSSSDPRENGRRLQKLQETKEKLGKSVNMRAMNMLSKAEEKYNELMKKKRIVENDKQKIMDTIKELDEKKNEALKKAWQQVNKDFGSIFSTLLPGTSAKLTPPEGKGILDGLEVKVAFGDVWKESLQELSGGQRSLVALSLILSLLLFKPAPLYILDEVDAALDLSHTQNIGQMLRTHFKHSQFIVVSLKDGMFNNANVLYKTKFVDGVSTVTRYAQQQSSLPPSVPASFARGKTTTTKKTSAKRERTEPLTEKTNCKLILY